MLIFPCTMRETASIMVRKKQIFPSDAIPSTSQHQSNADAALPIDRNNDERVQSSLQKRSDLPQHNITSKSQKRPSSVLDMINLDEVDDEFFLSHNNTDSGPSGPLYLAAYKSDNVPPYSLTEFNVKCMHCPAIHFNEEKSDRKKSVAEFSQCCNVGRLSNLEQCIDFYPDELKLLYLAENRMHKNFIANIRLYNSNFACASIACSRFNYATPGPPCYRIQGQMFHKFNQTAVPLKSDEVPTNGQLYFIDLEDSVNNRAGEQSSKDTEVMTYIEKCLRENYPYAHSYKMMKEVHNELIEQSIITGTAVPDVRLLFSLKKGYDPRTYNIPKTNEVCAIMVSDANGDVPPANIVVYLKGEKQLKNIYPLDQNVEPMSYPLFFPNNTKGWNYEMKDKQGRKISLCDFVKYRLHCREEGTFLPFHYGEKLFQQWVVDAAARIEWARLNYIRTHQKELCKNSYKNLTDYLKNKAYDNSAELTGQVVLPHSFIGGPRNMHHNFMDAMTIVAEVGKPDLFVTFTCNPCDPDILKCLKRNQTASSRPDIVARVFKLKKERLIWEITKGHIFGKTVGHVWVIEYQKRGLPHLHLLIKLDSQNKLTTKEKVDKVISAEIPDKSADPFLYDIVTRFMIHGPCGKNFPNASCWDKIKEKCSKKFPHKFREETILSDDGYPLYKRSNNGRYVWNKNTRLTNEHVVPYNPYLLKKFNAHINVEKVADIKAVKYLYKYIFKGYDSATVTAVVDDKNGNKKILKYDEVSNYLDARYLSPCEACWRIFKYPIQGKSHSVDLLTIHLEDEQPICFDKNDNDDIIEDKITRKSTLMAYFEFMQKNQDKNFLYTDMPKYCTWISKEQKWKFPRGSHFKALGRMIPVGPTDTEKFYLRLLLLHFPSKSFTDLKIVHGEQYNTYAQACFAHGLTRNDDEWRECLREAINFRFPHGLRNLFVNILLNCNPKFPGLLWDEFKDELSRDLAKNFSKEISYTKALALINLSLSYQDKSLKDFDGMPIISKNEELDDDGEIYDPYDEKNIANSYITAMYDEQQSIIKEIKNVIESAGQKLIFIDGPGGTGKSYTLNAIYHYARAYKKKVCNMAFSGIASTLLKKGRTLHNRFKLPLDIHRNSTSGIMNKTKNAIELIQTDVFILDEASMVSKFAFELINKKLKELMNNDTLFGGKNGNFGR